MYPWYVVESLVLAWCFYPNHGSCEGTKVVNLAGYTVGWTLAFWCDTGGLALVFLFMVARLMLISFTRFGREQA